MKSLKKARRAEWTDGRVTQTSEPNGPFVVLRVFAIFYTPVPGWKRPNVIASYHNGHSVSFSLAINNCPDAHHHPIASKQKSLLLPIPPNSIIYTLLFTQKYARHKQNYIILQGHSEQRERTCVSL